MSDAAFVRSRMRAARLAISAQTQSEAAQAVFAHIRALDAYREARCVMAYAACRGELSLEAVIGDVLGSGRTLALPRCEAPGVMTARRVTSRSQLVCGAYGLMEPDESCPVVPPREIDLILAPGTAFDRSGRRIGQGGGYYDRFLPKTSAPVIGVCHDFAVLAHIPAQPHDYSMHMLVTPSGVIRCSTEYEKREDRI